MPSFVFEGRWEPPDQFVREPIYRSIRISAWSLGFGGLVRGQATSRPLELCVGSAVITGVHLRHWCRIFRDVLSDLAARDARCGPV